MEPTAVADLALPVDSLLAEVTRFRDRRIVPAVERHEVPLNAAQLAALTAAAAALGVIPDTQGETTGVGLWEAENTVDNRRLSIWTISILAEANAGFALHLHQLALARWLERRLGAPPLPGMPVVALQGHYGLARGALARYLAETPPDDGDAALLREYFAPDAEYLLHAAHDWNRLWLPVWDDALQLQWWRLAHGAVGVKHYANSHGLDELHSIGCTATVGARPDFYSALDATAARRVLTIALAINSLGLLAVAAGAVRHARQLACDYTAIRRQGGAKIIKHPAIQLLLSRSALVLQLADQTLAALAAEDPATPGGLARIFAARAALHPTLCRAANDCLQCFGGIGYMRDTGAEKIVRDVNQLRLMHGTPAQLSLFLAALPNAAR